MAITRATRCKGATNSSIVKFMPSDRTVAPTEMAIPALNNAVSNWMAVTGSPSLVPISCRAPTSCEEPRSEQPDGAYALQLLSFFAAVPLFPSW